MSVEAMLTFFGDESMSVCASAIRGLIVAAPGKKLVVADYSNIEGRYLAWLAGEEWKLQAYRDRDAGTGEDMYKLLFHRMMGTPLDQIDDFLRQQGKGADLSMGYEGGVGAFLNIANSYKLDLVELGRNAPTQVAPEFLAMGARSWQWAVEQDETEGLPEDIYVACAALKHAYRAANAKIAQLWEELLNAAKNAVRANGVPVEVGRIAFKASADWLSMRIPSGRQIMFAKPKIETRPVVKKTLVGSEWKLMPKLDAEGNPVLRTQLTALKSPQWFREGIYGGLLANAATQGGCRDILVDAMLELDAEGWPIVLHVHDEVMAEIDDDDPRDHDAMIEVMLRQQRKYPGLPLNAAGFSAKRYKKQ